MEGIHDTIKKEVENSNKTTDRKIAEISSSWNATATTLEQSTSNTNEALKQVRLISRSEPSTPLFF